MIIRATTRIQIGASKVVQSCTDFASSSTGAVDVEVVGVGAVPETCGLAMDFAVVRASGLETFSSS